MADINEQTIVISDFLSFLSYQFKLTPKDKLLKLLRDYYTEKDISEAQKTLLASLPVKKSTRHGRRVKNPDTLVAIYDCLQLIPTEDLPVFVCKNVDNVPDFDIVKAEPVDSDETLSECEMSEENDIDEALKETHDLMKSQIVEISQVINHLREELGTLKGSDSVLASKHSLNSENLMNSSNNTNNLVTNEKLAKKKKGLAYLQSLIDEDGMKSETEDGLENEFDDADSQFSLIEYEELTYPEEMDKTGKGEQELVIPQRKHSKLKKRDSERKVIFIKNEDENTIEIASDDNFVGFENDDQLNMIENLDSVITISKNAFPESVKIEKIPATNCEGYYYKCQSCGFVCSEDKMIWSHECNSITIDSQNRKCMKSKRLGSNIWSCSVCDTSFKELEDFNEHMLNHTKIARDKDIHECILCNFKSSDYDQYITHLNHHSWKIPYQCDQCDYKSTKELRMKSHAVKHLECKGPNHFECLICHKICGTRNALDKHKLRHNRNYDFKCDICSLTFRHKSALTQHVLNHTKERIFVCSICGYRYESQHSLNVHIKVHFKDESFPCHICNLKFNTKSLRRKHILSNHEGVKAFQCDICNESFTFKYNLLLHRKTHGNRHFICNHCNKGFTSQYYLRLHRYVHEGKTPFSCSYCDFCSPSKALLKKHLLQHGETGLLNVYACDRCSFMTNSPEELSKHFEVAHPDVLKDNKLIIVASQ